MGKGLFSYWAEDQFSCTQSAAWQGYNAIIYLIDRSKTLANLKLQVSSLLIDSSLRPLPLGGTCKQWIFDSLTIRWASDSLGNGVFQGTSLVTNRSRVHRANTGAAVEPRPLKNGMAFVRKEGSGTAMYGIDGRRFAKRAWSPQPCDARADRPSQSLHLRSPGLRSGNRSHVTC
jgi:hypothetical protein